MLLDGHSEHLPQLRDDPSPGVEPGHEVTEQTPSRQNVLQGKPLLEQPAVTRHQVMHVTDWQSFSKFKPINQMIELFSYFKTIIFNSDV